MRNTHFTFTGKIARISESTMTALDGLKKLISATEKLKKELERIKAAPSRDHKETTSQHGNNRYP